MTLSKTKLWIIVTSALLLGALLGGVGGSYFGFYAWRSFNNFQQMLTAAHYSEFASIQYRSASYDEAKAALHEYIEFWEQLRSKESGSVRNHIYYMDTCFAYTRLGLLEEKHANKKQAEIYFGKSQQRCKEAGWIDYSAKTIRQVVTALDERNPMLKLQSDSKR